MLNTRLLALALATTLTGITTAQGRNAYPITIVDAAGIPVPVGTVLDIGGNTRVNALSPTEDAYLVFDPATPAGDYYVHVTNHAFDEVLSANDPMDRVVNVSYDTSGKTVLSTVNGTGNNVFGLDQNGHQTLLITPVSAPTLGGCQFKVFISDSWDENVDSSLVQRLKTNGNWSFLYFHIGDGTPGDIKGSVFDDTNGNGERDAGELGLPGWVVNLVDETSSIATTTDALGNYCFVDVGAGSFTTELTLQAGYSATTATANAVESTACADSDGQAFGVQMSVALSCDARTIGYWRNKHGRSLVNQHNILQLLPALCIVNRCGQYVCPTTISQYRRWMRRANSVNMAYMLSAQLVAMHNNVLVGYVDANCVIEDPCLGVMTIEELMLQAVASLCTNPYTPPCSGPARNAQRKLKNALDRANNNKIWQ
tara:strand:+ start:355 stop:1632 length:1278 start_codon:yes stop_codon:yes gene_type:complete